MPRHLAVLLVLVATFALSACGGDDESDTPVEQGVTTGRQDAPDTTEGATPPAGEDSSDGDAESAGDDGSSEDGGSDSDGDADAGDDGPDAAAAGIEATAATDLEIGTPLDEALDELGARPLGKRAGPGGTTCYVFRVRPESEDAPDADKRLRAQLCFKGGRLRGSTVVNVPLPPS